MQRVDFGAQSVEQRVVPLVGEGVDCAGGTFPEASGRLDAGRRLRHLPGTAPAVPWVKRMARMDLRSVLLELHAALDAERIEHVLIGGLALAAHGAGRATGDLDFIADGSRDADVDRVLGALGYRPLHRTPDVGNYVSDDPVRGRVDFLFVRRPRGRAILARAAPVDVLGISLRVADASDLIGLKVQAYANDPTRERQDLADVEKLLRGAKIDSVRVRDYFRLFGREQDLETLLEMVERWKR